MHTYVLAILSSVASWSYGGCASLQETADLGSVNGYYLIVPEVPKSLEYPKNKSQEYQKYQEFNTKNQEVQPRNQETNNLLSLVIFIISPGLR